VESIVGRLLKILGKEDSTYNADLLTYTMSKQMLKPNNFLQMWHLI